MNSRERLSRLFAGKEIDRVPVWLLFPYHRIGCYVDVYEQPSYQDIVEVKENYTDIFDRRGFPIGFCLNSSLKIKYDVIEEKQDGKIIRKTTVSYEDTVLTGVVVDSGEGGASRIEYMVKDIEDLEKILEMPYQAPRPDLTQFFKEKEELGDRGLMMASTGDPLGILYSLCKIEDFAIWTLTEKDRLLHFLDVMYERYLDFYEYLLENGVGPVYFIVGSEFAGPPVVSPTNFNDLSTRYVKGIVDKIRSYGMYSIVHYHGFLKDILQGMKEINPDALHTIEAPPVGNCTISEAREVLGDMILIGNIQYDELRSKTPEEMEEMVKEVLEEGKSGRFILSPTAGPYEKELSPRMQENYLKFMKAGLKYGKLD